MLQVTNLSKTFGDQLLFDNVSFGLKPRERLGLVGRNGCGKSTLFRILLGLESPDEGSVTTPKGYRVGHLAQHLEFHEESIIKEACLGLPADERDQEYRGEIILSGLGFSESDMSRPASLFSGGFQIRINLARLLLSEPNLLLLDEPTNYLDIVSVRWLAEFLRDWKNELILITHDRSFMDSVTTDTMVIHRAGIKKLAGGTQKLYQQIEQDEVIYEKTRLNDDKKRKDLEAFITRFRAQASKAALVQSRVKQLEKMGQRDALSEVESLEFRFCEAPHPGKLMGEIKSCSFQYPDSPRLIKDLSFALQRHDRIGIIGKNGKGKSTLLKLIAGELMPNSGEITLSPNARIGYFGQTNISHLRPSWTVEEEIGDANPLLGRTVVRAICGTMMFSGDDALKKISVLSGGERSRVLLGRILAQPTNVLLLDEPTNHLDMQSIDAMIESLRSYEGALLLVTHSELLLRELVNRLIVFEGEAPHLVEGGYDYFLEKEGWQAEGGMTALHEPKKQLANEVPERSKKGSSSKKIEKMMKKLEEEICESERQLQAAERSLSIASQAGEREAMHRFSSELARLQVDIEQKFLALEALEVQLKQGA